MNKQEIKKLIIYFDIKTNSVKCINMFPPFNHVYFKRYVDIHFRIFSINT